MQKKFNTLKPVQKKIISIFVILLLSTFELFSVTDESKYVTFLEYEYSIEDILSNNFDTIYIAASSPTSEHVGSLGAHAFIVLAKGDDVNNGIAINYYAYHESQSEVEKIFRGTTVGLTGYIDIRKFNQLAERYTNGQQRTLFLYKTNIESNKIPELLNIVYEYKKSDLKYNFFLYNCSSLLGDVLSELLTTEEKEYSFPHAIMPARLITLVKNYSLIVDEKTISPPLVKLFNDDTTQTKSDILDRYSYYKVFGRETTTEDGFDDFVANFDNFKANTLFSEKVSKLSLGFDNNNPSISFSIFNNNISEQRQSAISLYTFKFMETELVYDDGIKLDSLTFLEKLSYTKVNLLKMTPSTSFSIKYNSNNSNIDIASGVGIAFGTLNTLIGIIPTVETNLEDLELTLKIKSNLKVNYGKSFLLVDLDYPIYNEQTYSNKELSLSLGYQITNDFLVDCSYDFLNNEYKVNFNYFIYPLIK
ncbi:MAG: DUF4105 domain-containing protein [Pleomorphochaeta sp.]